MRGGEAWVGLSGPDAAARCCMCACSAETSNGHMAATSTACVRAEASLTMYAYACRANVCTAACPSAYNGAFTMHLHPARACRQAGRQAGMHMYGDKYTACMVCWFHGLHACMLVHPPLPLHPPPSVPKNCFLSRCAPGSAPIPSTPSPLLLSAFLCMALHLCGSPLPSLQADATEVLAKSCPPALQP
eukprot:356122-Chlamydomonas_euryale.AAC.1